MYKPIESVEHYINRAFILGTRTKSLFKLKVQCSVVLELHGTPEVQNMHPHSALRVNH